MAAYDGFHYDQTTFGDGWVSDVKPDWVEVTRGTMKVLLHYPREGTIVPGDPAFKLANAWNILVAPRYSNLQNWYVAETITMYNADDVASASVQELATGNSKYVVLFRRTGYWMEFISPDKATFMQNFQNIDINTVTWQSPLTTYDALSDMSGRNYFAVHPSDLSGEWTNRFSSMQNYYNLYTGSTVGTFTYNSYEYFNYKTSSTYDWKLQVVAGYEAQYGYQEVNSSGSFSVASPWQINYSWIENRARNYDAYFSCVKNGRILWMRDQGFVGNGSFTPYGRSANNVSVPVSPGLVKLEAGRNQIKVHFSPSSFDGGAAISQYTATCTSTQGGAPGFATSTGASPISVAGLTNRANYQCSVKASNSVGDSYSSSAMSATPRPVDLTPILNLLLN
ncbi:MAG: fibronectin type III domain-containing protein [Comamonadaceae bacterium]|nr:fibronectin type III domain-containing protein [Comamonadaceae bacterium]